MKSLRTRLPEDYPQRTLIGHESPPGPILLLSPVLTVALVAAVAPFVSWRQAPEPRGGDGRGLRPSPTTISFNEHIRPIFVDNCFRCHGSDPGSRKAELRLDRPEFAFAPRANGQPVIVKGNPGQSALVRRITSTDPDKVMPPPETHKTLEPREKALLERWIKDGAEYQPHWAFIKPERPTPPEVRQADRVRNPIDRFVLARLEEEGLTPNPEADRHTLDPPRHPRPDRPAAHPGRGRGLRPRRLPEGLRSAGRPAAGPSELRRAPGAVLARLRALRRHARLSLRQLPQHLALPRLGDRRLQRQPALRPVHARADCRGPAAEGRRTTSASPPASSAPA